ncbi:DUF3313 family protein [Brevundimonas sp.]|jgi:hypothetical protein|uniref:DUF3313 family protein n=1 Tax=Brevundimonas sp. TaxID=1871086 RepID=UPI003783B45A
MKSLPLILVAGLAVTACQTAPVANAGFLSRYDGLVTREDTIRASIRQSRDDAEVTKVETVFLEPSVLVGEASAGLSEAEKAQVLREVDRQICYEVSERFTLADAPTGAARLRTAVVGIRPTGGAAGGVSAVANAFIPGPGTFRVPGTTGGLAVESELLSQSGSQIAALAWARNANVVGTDTPSLSRIGDALQLAEPLGDTVGDTISQPDRPVRDIADPDPCSAYGPRTQPAGFVARMVTGLYVPQINTGTAADKPKE